MKLIGELLLLSGCLSLVFNESTMRLRRVWPWRRDDLDPERNEWLNEFYRLSVWGGSIVAIELGLALADVAVVPRVARLLTYGSFGAFLLWKRPALRSREFWERVPHRGTMPRRNRDSTKQGR